MIDLDFLSEKGLNEKELSRCVLKRFRVLSCFQDLLSARSVNKRFDVYVQMARTERFAYLLLYISRLCRTNEKGEK